MTDEIGKKLAFDEFDDLLVGQKIMQTITLILVI